MGAKRCAGCGCHLNDHTQGCANCYHRHRQRRLVLDPTLRHPKPGRFRGDLMRNLPDPGRAFRTRCRAELRDADKRARTLFRDLFGKPAM